MLETHGVSKNFGKLVALNDVSFQVEQGEIFGIAGPNGAGKSTLFNVITGIYSPTSGKIFFNGHDIIRLKPHEVCHRGIGRTYQIPATFHTLSVYDNVRVGSTFGGHHKHKSGTPAQPDRQLRRPAPEPRTGLAPKRECWRAYGQFLDATPAPSLVMADGTSAH